jgi:hypothetical protein
MDPPSVPMKRSNDGIAFDLTHAIRLHIKQKDAQAKMEKKRSLVTKVPPRQTLGVLSAVRTTQTSHNACKNLSATPMNP